jgi:dTDP-4-amino-4,6-dideoxygalactose transaminase
MVTNNDDLATRARIIANHGRLGKFDHMMEGRNSRLDGLQAAILSAKLPHLPRWTELRRSHAAVYDQLLREVGIQLPEAPPYALHVYHLYVIQVPDRERVREELAANGVDTGIHYPIPLPFLKAYSRMKHQSENFPVASAGMGRILSLPMFAEMTENQREYVATSLRSIIKIQ